MLAIREDKFNWFWRGSHPHHVGSSRITVSLTCPSVVDWRFWGISSLPYRSRYRGETRAQQFVSSQT
ncbi:hypothetical protein RRG08_038277 [Elysia crispata]|uniref:Uncharacterized protein n=1 Tax=Elysia crispata TaxID=231223 RepID=A0AAE1E1F6_9GAST|nr:hypothetical protein RRG08_038277 [Elysia crispata]